MYWSDRVVGTYANLIICDGMRLNGSIHGGLSRYQPDDKVPSPRSKGCDLLSYESTDGAKARGKAESLRAQVRDILSQEQLLHLKRPFCEDRSGATNKRIRKGRRPRERPKSLSARWLRSPQK